MAAAIRPHHPHRRQITTRGLRRSFYKRAWYFHSRHVFHSLATIPPLIVGIFLDTQGASGAKSATSSM